MRIVGAAALLIVVAVNGFGQAAQKKGPEIRILDDRISIRAEAVPLARLIGMIDQATGLKSKVPPELANRNVSVMFSDLPFEAAVKKVFEGLPIDYVVIRGTGIVVTAQAVVTGVASGSNPPSAAQDFPRFDAPSVEDMQPPFQPEMIPQPAPVLVQPGIPQQPFGQPVNPFGQPFGQQQGQMPAMIQTPFGPIPNPNVNQQQQFGAQPASTPGDSGFGSAASNPMGFGNTAPPMFNNSSSPSPMGQFPSTQYPTTSPYGTTSPFGASPYPTTNPYQTQPGLPTPTPQPRKP